MRISIVEIFKTKSDYVVLKTWSKLTKDSTNLIEDLALAIKETGMIHATAAVFGIAGPVDEIRQEVPILVDIPQWGKISAEEIGKALGIHKVVLMNDFVANAYGVVSINDESDIVRVHSPAERCEDRVRLVYGVGTGLGVSMLCRPDESKAF